MSNISLSTPLPAGSSIILLLGGAAEIAACLTIELNSKAHCLDTFASSTSMLVKVVWAASAVESDWHDC
jgi:hypothetical protein